MNCSEFESRLSEYVDGELPSATQLRFIQHRDECPQCGELFSGFQTAMTAIRSLPEKQTSPDFSQRLFARINELEQRSFLDKLFGLMPNHLFPRYAIAMALATVILFVGYRSVHNDLFITEPDSSLFPPPALNVPQPMTISEQSNNLLNHPITTETDTHDTNQITPPQERRSFEGQIRYVKGSQ